MRGYSSLWLYVHQALGYSESQASERISAMRLMVRVPEVREEIENNRLTLTAAAKLATHVRRERNNESETIELLGAIHGKSTREVERVLASQASEPVRIESVRPISAETTRILMDVDQDFLNLLNQVRELQGHFGSSTSELIQTAMKGFVKMHPKNKKGVDLKQVAAKQSAPKQSVTMKSAQNKGASIQSLVLIEKETLRAPEVQGAKTAFTHAIVNNQRSTSQSAKSSASSPTASSNRIESTSRTIPVAIQRAVRARSGNQCEFVDSKTQKRCDCKVQLEFDHRLPFAMGGQHTLENLRHLCRAHNQLAAIQFYGNSHMKQFLKN
jgi:hypothetical protein